MTAMRRARLSVIVMAMPSCDTVTHTHILSDFIIRIIIDTIDTLFVLLRMHNDAMQIMHACSIVFTHMYMHIYMCVCVCQCVCACV